MNIAVPLFLISTTGTSFNVVTSTMSFKWVSTSKRENAAFTMYNQKIIFMLYGINQETNQIVVELKKPNKPSLISKGIFGCVSLKTVCACCVNGNR